jgi:segregation and condensation protein A
VSKSRASASRRAAGQAREKAAPARELNVPPTPLPVEPAAVEPAFEGQYRVQLPAFEGPLDLLLHLIQQHEIDILDIPVSFITEKYLAYLKLMRSLAIDVASEYLVMAATLVHIKSKMLLPSVPAGQEDDSVLAEEEDPRAELVRRLLEYQKYKAAAADLAERGTLGRDVFMRPVTEAEPEGVAPFAAMGVFSLLEAFEKVLKRSNIKIDHEVVFDRISITDRIVELTERLTERRRMRFEDMVMIGLPGPTISRFDVVITFLAVLEMARLKLIRVYQSDPLAPLHVELAAGGKGGDEPPPNFDFDEEPEAREQESASEAAPEVAPEAAPEAAPEVVTEVVAEAAPEVVTEAAPEVVTEVAPEAVTEAAPEAAPETELEAAPEAALEEDTLMSSEAVDAAPLELLDTADADVHERENEQPPPEVEGVTGGAEDQRLDGEDEVEAAIDAPESAIEQATPKPLDETSDEARDDE